MELDLSNYAIKTDLKNVTHVDVSSFASKTNLASLKTEVDKLDADKLVPVPNDLAKLSNVVKNDVVKKTEYNKLVTKTNGIDTINFVLKTKYEKDGSDFEDKINKVDKKIPDVSDLVKKTNFNAKITEVEDKIPNTTGLATSSALTAVENKIPGLSSLVKKADYDTKISEIEKKITDHNHDKYITAPEFNTMAADVFNARLAQENVVTKTDFDAKQSGLKKITTSKTKHLLVENELKKLEKCDTAYFRGKNYFEEDGTQNYLVFQPVCIYFEKTGDKFSSWKSKGLSDEKIISTTTSTDKSATKTIYDNARIKVRFNGDLLRQNQVVYNHGPVVNIYIVYETTQILKLLTLL